MTSKQLTIATRESPLALWQANYIKQQLESHWKDLRVDLLPMKTTGDKFLKDKLQSIGGKGLFVKELEEAMLAQKADLAVHSMKDVPAQLPPGLILPAICERHDPFDALLSQRYKNLEDLPQKAKVGTVSLRRQTQLKALRNDLVMAPLRGNILTRIETLKAGTYDAIILAVSGLERMKLENQIKQRFNANEMLPAVGQGALGIECRENDSETVALLAPLNDPATHTCVHAERKVNQRLGGNCHAPLAVYCRHITTHTIQLDAKVMSFDGQSILHSSHSGGISDALELAERCANALIQKGALEFIQQAIDHENRSLS